MAPASLSGKGFTVSKRKLYYAIYGVMLILLLGVPLGIALLPKGRVFYYLLAAQNMMNEGNVQGAVTQAQKAVEIRPESLMALSGLAKAYIASGQDKEAEKTVIKLLDISPDLAEGYYYLGLIRFHRGDFEGAREAVEQSVSLSPEFADNYRLLAAIALQKKDIEAAEKHLGKALELDPENPDSHHLSGAILMEKGQYHEAIGELEKVTRLAPDFAPGHALLARCYFETKLYVHALSEMKIAVDLDPSDYNSMYDVACIYSIENKPEPAVKWLERAIDNGFIDFEHMKKDPDLDNIRKHPKYIELVKRGPIYSSHEETTAGG